MLSPRLIAMEGVGGSLRLLAVRGLWGASETEHLEGGGGYSTVDRRIVREPDHHLAQLRREDQEMLDFIVHFVTRHLS